MREIKFRVFAGGEVSRPVSIHNMIKAFAITNKELPEDMPIMQYTGLKDKNGKEIYEGDILKTSKGNFEIIWIESIAGFGGKALFDVAMFAPKDADASEYAQAIFDGGMTSNYSSFEVIGNIYENPDLTK